MLAIPNQTPGVIERHGLTRQQVDSAVWSIDGSVKLSGSAAVNRVFAELGWPWSLLAAAGRSPGLNWLEEQAYRLVARNRALLGRVWSDPPPFPT